MHSVVNIYENQEKENEECGISKSDSNEILEQTSTAISFLTPTVAHLRWNSKVIMRF